MAFIINNLWWLIILWVVFGFLFMGVVGKYLESKYEDTPVPIGYLTITWIVAFPSCLICWLLYGIIWLSASNFLIKMAFKIFK